MGDFLDFKEISKIPFIELLDTLSLPYTVTHEGVKGNGKFHFLVNVPANIYLDPHDKLNKGSVINFYAKHAGITLREAAKWLKDNFLAEAKPLSKCPDYELTYHDWLKEQGITEETAKELEIGLAPGKSMLRGRIAFAIHDKDGKKIAYAGRAIKEDSKPLYLFPKGYKHEHLYLLNRLLDNKWCILVPNWAWAVKLHQSFPNRVLSTLALNLTDAHAFLLRQIKVIYILDVASDNWTFRLAKYSLVKAPKVPTPLINFSKEFIESLLRAY